MQKFFKDSITKKILIVLVIAILCNFIIPNYSQAEDIGGVLFDPIRWLLSVSFSRYSFASSMSFIPYSSLVKLLPNPLT